MMPDDAMLEVIEETKNPDGSWNLEFEVNDEFKTWFKEWQSLKRWSNKRFQKIIYEALTHTLDIYENTSVVMEKK